MWPMKATEREEMRGLVLNQWDWVLQVRHQVTPKRWNILYVAINQSLLLLTGATNVSSHNTEE